MAAFAVPLPGQALSEMVVLKHCMDYMQPFMVPKYVRIVESPPRSPNGKIAEAAPWFDRQEG
jgi:acyl-coenzyme A synthetase/AMP-(fatty) acid ligase